MVVTFFLAKKALLYQITSIDFDPKTHQNPYSNTKNSKISPIPHQRTLHNDQQLLPPEPISDLGKTMYNRDALNEPQ